MNNKKQLFISLGLFTLFSVICFSTYYYFHWKYEDILSKNIALVSDNTQLKNQITEIQNKSDSTKREYENELTALKKELNDKKVELENVPKLSDLFVNRYKTYNLNDPQKDIAEDLKKRVDIVPEKAVLGGMMQIDNVLILSPNYAYATYSDGHIQGYMLLKFSISKDGKISWQVLKYES